VVTSPTKPGTRKLSEVARKVVAPSGIAATGWPAVEHTCRVRLGVEFDPWQHGAGRLILSKRGDGKLACMIGGVGMSLPRQVGKTYLIGSMAFALCVNQPGLLVIWSAHHARTHGETFLSMQAFAERSKVRPYVSQVFKGSGDEEIRFHNGSRILFGARERGFGRGVPGVDMIVSDEAQIMTDKALDAQLATMNTSAFGLAIYVGTPPRPDDPSEAFTRMRAEAWNGTLRDAAWIEFGAEPGVDPTDRAAWAKANPSYPRRTPVESIQRLQRKLTAESFLREGLGVWDPAATNKITPGMWALCADAESTVTDPVSFGIEVSEDRAWACIAIAGRRPDGLTHGEIVQYAQGTNWIVDRVVELRDKWRPLGFVIDPSGPAGSLIPDLEARGITVTKPTRRDIGYTCGALFDAVKGRTFHHRDEPALNISIKAAKQRSAGDAWVFDRRGQTDVTPLLAMTLALRPVLAAPVPLDSDALLQTFY
jgi:hypothetical protein